VSSTSFISNVDANDIFMIHITCIGFSSGRDYFFRILYFFFPFVPGGFLEQKAAFEAKTRTDISNTYAGRMPEMRNTRLVSREPLIRKISFPDEGLEE
jgi:hypothetical protein